jgi:AMMECR1 domain-containing protein
VLAGGDVCLVDAGNGELLWWRGDAEVRAVASAGDGRFAVLDATGLTEYGYPLRVALGPSTAPRNYAAGREEQSWDDAPVASGLHPAVAARRALDHYLRTGRLPAPPEHFGGDYKAPGGVWISARRRSDSWLLTRGGFWSFEPDARPLTLAVWDGLQRAVADGAHPLREAWPNVKIGITLVHELARVALGALDHERYGVVATPAGRRSPAGDAPPNGQGVASELEQCRHARARAGLRPAEPADLYRYSTSKLTEPGEAWLPHASPPRRIDSRLGEALVARALAEIAGATDGRESTTDASDGELDALVEADGVPVAGVAVSIYFRGVVGCATGWRGTLMRMVGDAARAAYRDPRLIGHIARREDPDAVVVTLMHSPMRLAGVPASYFSRTLQQGLDSFSVRQGPRFAVFLDSVIPHYDVRPEQALEQLLAKAGIAGGPVTWTSYRSAAWAYTGGRLLKVRRGFPVRQEPPPPTTVVERLATFLMEHRTCGGLIAWRTFPVRGHEEPHGSLSHALHALYALARAGASGGETTWAEAAERGLLASLHDAPHPGPPPGRARRWRSSWSTNAVLLLALTAVDVRTENRRKLLQLAATVRRAVRDDGRIAPPGTAAPADEDHDYLPGVVLLALARLAGKGIDVQAVDWRRTLVWYRRRFRLAESWGIAFWHPQAWAAVHALEPRSEYASFVFEIVDWALERQLAHNGAFVTDPSPLIPSFHTACATEGVAAAWALADRLGETERVRRYKAAWHAAVGSLAQLTIAPEDMFCMRDRAAVGGVRMHAASGEVRADYVSHALLAYLEAPLP